jgi:DNA polymerase delta subunit 4
LSLWILINAIPVHQEGLSMNEKILRHFDLSSQYGVSYLLLCDIFKAPTSDITCLLQPCIGITRMERWKRANNLDLHPPIEVLAVLLQEEEKENSKAERAHVDELMSSRFSAED